MMLVRLVRAAHWERVALAVMIAVVSVINVLWVRSDTDLSPEPDTYVYLRLLLRSIDTLQSVGVTGAWDAIAELSHGGRPPLYQLLTMPFIFLFGRSEDAALLVNVFFEALLLLATFAIGRTCSSERAGLLGAFLIACYPPIVGLSRIYKPHFAVPACVALSVWLLLLLLKDRSAKLAWLFAASLTFGMWIHPSFAWVLTVPALVFGIHLWLFAAAPRFPSSIRRAPAWFASKLRDPMFRRGLLPAGLAAGCAIALWYLTVGHKLFALYEKYSPRLGGATQFAVDGFPEVSSLSWWYLFTAPGALSWPLSVLIGAALLWGIFRRTRSILVLVVTLIGAYLLINLQPARAWWIFASVLPVAAALTAIFIGEIRNRWLSRALTVVCLAVGSFTFGLVTWGIGPWIEPVAAALGAPIQSPTCVAQGAWASRVRRYAVLCPNLPQKVDWRHDEILQIIRDDPDCRNSRCSLLVMQFTYQFSPVVLHYRLRERWHDLRLIVDLARFRRNLSPDYLLDLAPGATAISPILLPDASREVATFVLPNGETARLIKRID